MLELRWLSALTYICQLTSSISGDAWEDLFILQRRRKVVNSEGLISWEENFYDKKSNPMENSSNEWGFSTPFCRLCYSNNHCSHTVQYWLLSSISVATFNEPWSLQVSLPLINHSMLDTAAIIGQATWHLLYVNLITITVVKEAMRSELFQLQHSLCDHNIETSC